MFAQTTTPSVQPSPQTAPPAALVYSNRHITDFRVSVLTRTPADRVAAAVAQLNTIAAAGPSGPVAAQRLEGVIAVTVGGHGVFVIVPDDVDQIGGETLEQKAAAAVSRLQTAVDEQVELRTPARLAWSVVQVLLVTVVFAVLLWLIRRGYRVMAARLSESAERRLGKFSEINVQLMRASRASDAIRRFIMLVAVVLALVLSYSWLTFTLRRFPDTRPLGESLREFLLTKFAAIGLAIVRWLPDLLTIAVIVVVTRFVARLAQLVFDAVEQERMTLPGVYPETAQPTRRLVSALLWLFALVLSYPYLPGSDSDAFKGVSVFVGLILSLGSSGIVNQAMSGLTMTYSRALRLGDFVRIGDVEGTVSHLGSLSTKIKTGRREDVTIPNAVVVSSAVTNYSRYADGEGYSSRRPSPSATTWPGARFMRSFCLPQSGPPGSSGVRLRGSTNGFTRLLRRVHAAVLSGTAASSCGDAWRAARQHSGYFQRGRRADHVPQLRS